jgi:hypothetical protein
MRNGMNASFIHKSDFIGVNLGADYVSEHEWGIKSLKRYLGVDENADMGLPCRKVNEVHNLHWFESKDFIGIVCYHFYDDTMKNWKPRETYGSDKAKSFYSGWAQDGFYLLTKNTKTSESTINKIKKIYDALNNKNACIWLGGGGVFENAGLCIGIIDKMDKTIFQEWSASDKKKADTKAAFDKSGIEEFLRKAGKKWFALSPSMVNGKLKIWLNPYEQRIHNAGSFTVDELKLWAKDQGPVMMKK